MLFNSFAFLIFFPIVVTAYYVLPKKMRQVWLLLASYFYYMCWNPRYIAFLLLSTLSTYACGLLIEKADRDGKQQRIKTKKVYMVLCIILNIGLLAFFKYAQFFVNSVNYIFSIINIKPLQYNFSIVVPIGISFYTLQAVGYIIDVFRGDVAAEKNILRYGLFVSFFPQTLSGPIGRAKSLIPQMYEPKTFDFSRVRSGLLRMAWGMFIKLVLTERLNILVNTVFENYYNHSGFTLVLGAVAFGLQIYCDFSSYSNLAIGAGEVLGIRLMENFKTPYLSESVAEFWRRWHISLSTWFRDYIYIPLGGNRRGKLRKHINLMIVFVISGLWHGSSWNYIIWGGMNGLFQIISDATKSSREKALKLLQIDKTTWGSRLSRIILTFILIDFNWIFFRASGVNEAIIYIGNIFTDFNPWVFFDGTFTKLGLTAADNIIVFLSLLVLLMVDIANYKGISIREKIAEQGIVFRWTVYYVAIFSVIVFGIYGPAYEASAFIYSQF